MATYYVDGAVGNDGNAGTAAGAGNAWATIQKAANTVAAGDLVYVKSGTYAENVSLSTAGSSGSRIIFRGYASTPGDLDTDSQVYTGGRIGHASRPIITGSNSRAYCLTIAATAAYYEFHGFVLTAPTTAIYGWHGGAAAFRFQNCCLVKGTGACAQAALLSGFTELNPDWLFCEFDSLNSGLAGAHFYGCEIHDLAVSSSTFAIAVGDFRSRWVHYCHFYNLPGGGVSFAATDSIGDVVGCTFYDLGNDAIKAVNRAGNGGSVNNILENLAVNVAGRPINWTNGASPSYYLRYSGIAYYNCSSAPLLPALWPGAYYMGGDTQLAGNPFQAVGSDDYRVVTASGFSVPFPPGFPRGAMTSARPFGAAIGAYPSGGGLRRGDWSGGFNG